MCYLYNIDLKVFQSAGIALNYAFNTQFLDVKSKLCLQEKKNLHVANNFAAGLF